MSPRVNWRHIVDAAIAEGDAAEIQISTRDLEALLSLPPDKRLSIIDKEVADQRLDNLLPDDLKTLRESLGGKGRVPKLDPKAVAEARHKRMVLSLEKYIAGYAEAIRRAEPALKAAAGVVSGQQIVKDLLAGAIKRATSAAASLRNDLDFQRALRTARALRDARAELKEMWGAAK